MAFKDLTDYYQKVRAAYFNTLSMCEEFDKEHKEGLLEDKDFKKFTKNVTILRDRYQIISDFFILWSKPTEEETKACEDWKKNVNNKTDYNYIAKRSPDEILKADTKVLQDIKDYITKLKEQSK